MNRSLVRVTLLLVISLVCFAGLFGRSTPITAQTIIVLTPDADTGRPTGEPQGGNEHPGDVLPQINPIELPPLPIGITYTPLISDEQYLSGFSLDTAEIQRRLVEIGSVLGQTNLIFDE